MVFSIALYVGAYFLFPKFRIVLRPHKIVTTLMPMPETTVYKDHSLIFGKNNIRFSWKPSVIFSVPESLRKQVFSDKFFWFSILSTDTGHIIASGFRRMDIGHKNPPFRLVFVFSLNSTRKRWKNGRNGLLSWHGCVTFRIPTGTQSLVQMSPEIFARNSF